MLVIVRYVPSVRNWKDNLPAHAHLYGAYRKRDLEDQRIVPHSFTFVRRSGSLDSKGYHACHV